MTSKVRIENSGESALTIEKFTADGKTLGGNDIGPGAAFNSYLEPGETVTAKAQAATAKPVSEEGAAKTAGPGAERGSGEGKAPAAT